MPESKRKVASQSESDLGLEGFENFFDGASDKVSAAVSANGAAEAITAQLEKLLSRFGDLVSLTVEQRVETARITNQIIENQRQLIATQQILIRLMEKSIELTRHIAGIEEKLPAVFELPRIVEDLRARVAQLEGVDIY